MAVQFRVVVFRLGAPEQFLQSFGSGRCTTCGRMSALTPCNYCAGRFMKLIKRESSPRLAAKETK